MTKIYHPRYIVIDNKPFVEYYTAEKPNYNKPYSIALSMEITDWIRSKQLTPVHPSMEKEFEKFAYSFSIQDGEKVFQEESQTGISIPEGNIYFESEEVFNPIGDYIGHKKYAFLSPSYKEGEREKSKQEILLEIANNVTSSSSGINKYLDKSPRIANFLLGYDYAVNQLCGGEKSVNSPSSGESQEELWDKVVSEVVKWYTEDIEEAYNILESLESKYEIKKK